MSICLLIVAMYDVRVAVLDLTLCAASFIQTLIHALGV